MKSIITVIALAIVCSAGACMTPQEASAQQAAVSFQLFYDELSPYGMWVEYPNYGYVWIPNADPEFSPYASAGHWILTDDGWTWVSDYPWGWATFHYGRWDYDDEYGWLWVPDNEWGPAWVSWRTSPGYYGWAPLRPGISMSMAFGRDYHERNERWVFVRDGDFGRSDIGHRYINRNNNASIITASMVITNTRRDNRRDATYIAGPDRDDVQRVTHTTINPVAIRETNQPGHRLNNGELQIYRPRVQKETGNGQSPVPSKLIKLNDVKPVSERNAGNRQERPGTVSPSNESQPVPSRDVGPARGRALEEQPRMVRPPNSGQPLPPRDVEPPRGRALEEQPRTVRPPNNAQPLPPREVNPASGGRALEEQPRTVRPPNSSQPPPLRGVGSSDGNGKVQQTRAVKPPRAVQPARPQGVGPTGTRGNEKQSRDAGSSGKQDKVQPKTQEDEKEKIKRE